MSKYRMRPPDVGQTKTYSCWAACLESFSKSTPGIPTFKEKYWLDNYGTGTNGGLNKDNLDSLKSFLGGYSIGTELVSNMDLTPYYIEEKLAKSHVVLMYQERVNSDDWHAIVVYGIDNWLIFMDPRKTAGNRYDKTKIYNMISVNGFYVVSRN